LTQDDFPSNRLKSDIFQTAVTSLVTIAALQGCKNLHKDSPSGSETQGANSFSKKSPEEAQLEKEGASSD